MNYSAHVQHPKASGYLMAGGQFTGTRQEALNKYISLCLEGCLYDLDIVTFMALYNGGMPEVYTPMPNPLYEGG